MNQEPMPDDSLLSPELRTDRDKPNRYMHDHDHIDYFMGREHGSNHFGFFARVIERILLGIAYLSGAEHGDGSYLQQKQDDPFIPVAARDGETVFVPESLHDAGVDSSLDAPCIMSLVEIYRNRMHLDRYLNPQNPNYMGPSIDGLTEDSFPRGILASISDEALTQQSSDSDSHFSDRFREYTVMHLARNIAAEIEKIKPGYDMLPASLKTFVDNAENATLHTLEGKLTED